MLIRFLIVHNILLYFHILLHLNIILLLRLSIVGIVVSLLDLLMINVLIAWLKSNYILIIICCFNFIKYSSIDSSVSILLLLLGSIMGYHIGFL